MDCMSSKVLLDGADRTGKNNQMPIRFPLLHIEGKFKKKIKNDPLLVKLKGLGLKK